MKVYMRDSLMKQADQAYLKEIMSVTKRGMHFYKDLFGKDYAFSKYDQVFAPEFASGAMENVGCVTFSENLLHLDELNTVEKKK
jgi:aminopeptidase N